MPAAGRLRPIMYTIERNKKMKEQIIIRNEREKDYEAVELLIRKAFWNLYIPGCTEHFVAHEIRSHEDFVRELDLVMEKDGEIIGNIMYTKTKLVDEAGNEKQILTFGPVCISPEFQRCGYGKLLMEKSFEKAVEMGYEVIVIFGSPVNYVARGFKSCKKYNVCLEGDAFPTPMLVKELREGALDGRKWIYQESPAFQLDENEAEGFDEKFEPWEKKWQPSQEEFYINSHSQVL